MIYYSPWLHHHRRRLIIPIYPYLLSSSLTTSTITITITVTTGVVNAVFVVIIGIVIVDNYDNDNVATVCRGTCHADSNQSVAQQICAFSHSFSFV